MTSLMVCETCPTALRNVHVYAPPSFRSTSRISTRVGITRTRSDDVISWSSLRHVTSGSGVAVASQNSSTVSPSLWTRNDGDTWPSTGGAATVNHYCYHYLVGLCQCVRWSRSSALHKRLNRSWCRLGADSCGLTEPCIMPMTYVPETGTRIWYQFLVRMSWALDGVKAAQIHSSKFLAYLLLLVRIFVKNMIA